MTPVFDSHAHLNDERFKHDVDDVIDRARETGVRRIVVPGYEVPSSKRALKLAQRYPWIYAASGISPHEATTANRKTLNGVWFMGTDPNTVAIGEIGLDYYYDNAPRETQKVVFREQLAMARDLGKPVIIHLRDASDDLFGILAGDGVPEAGGVLHCFTGTAAEAARGVELGLHISFSAILLFAKGEQITEAAASVPVERLLVETDSPYLSPPPWRGKRNEPSYVLKTLVRLAEIHNKSEQEMAEQTWKNACELFGLDVSEN